MLSKHDKMNLGLTCNSRDLRPRSAESHANESGGCTSNENKFKTSTPNKNMNENPTDISNLSNISSIRPSSAFSRYQPLSSNSMQRSTTLHRRTFVPKFDRPMQNRAQRPNMKIKNESKATSIDDNDMYTIHYNKMMQSILLDKITQESQARAKDKIDEEVASLRKKITNNLKMLNKTKEQFQQISVNCEIEDHLKTFGNDFKVAKEISNKTKSGRTDRQNKVVVKKLKEMQNKISCENIAVPQSSSEILKLNKTIKETLSAYENVSRGDPVSIECLNDNKEASDLLKEYKKFEKGINHTQNSCGSILPSINSLVLENCSNKITDKELEEKHEDLK